MCGINGIFNFKSKTIVNQYDISKMVQQLIHRGPDQDSVFTEKNLGLGFTRLSIIDLQNGMQPIESISKRYVIICNGEIYNYQKLRQDLIKNGYEFKTNSDVETILGLFEIGIKIPEKQLNGMFAFACYDRYKEKLILSRDRMGEKTFILLPRSEWNLFQFRN